MMLGKGAKTYKLRIRLKDGRSATLSTGVQDAADYRDVKRAVARWKGRKGIRCARPDVLVAVVTKQITLAEAYLADVEGRLDLLMSEVRDRTAVVELSPLVVQWEKQGADPKYVRQVRRLIPAGSSFPLTRFTRPELGEWIRTLEPEERVSKLTAATRRHYKTALSVFAEFLIERNLLTANPVLRLPLRTPIAEKNKPIIFLEPEQVKALVMGLDEPYRSLEALMAGTGMEWQAVSRCRGRDVNLAQWIVFADGGKTSYRRRYVEFTESWAWSIVKRHVVNRGSDWPLWDVDEKEALEAHHATAERLGLPRTTLHHHRHSFAVMWIRRGACGGLRKDGRDEQWLKNQLGHGPRSNQLRTTYGVYINEARLSQKATNEATSHRKGLR